MPRRLTALGCALALAGCALDFDSLRVPVPRDASAVVDTPDVSLFDAPDVVDATVDQTPDVPPHDAPPPDHAICAPGHSSAGGFRFAHMAPGIGTVDLCMRQRNGAAPFQRVLAPRWPATGIEYAQVSVSLPFNTTVRNANEAWEFAVVPAGTLCSRAATTAVTLQSVQLDPGAMRLLVLTTERSAGGSAVGVLNMVSDEDCTDCTQRQVDVRGVHAAPGSAAHRLNFSLEPVIGGGLLPQDLAMMRVFATGVGYGSAGDYVCNSFWGGIAALGPVGSNIPVQFTVSTAAGDLVARSNSTLLKALLLQRTRVATVFFEGDFGAGSGDPAGAPGFVVCYDGVSMLGLTTCDRIMAHLMPGPDAGMVDAGVTDTGNDASDVDNDVSDAALPDDAVNDAALPDDAISIPPLDG